MLFAGAASPSEQSASITILGLGGLKRITCITSEQVRTEAMRNIRAKFPWAEPKLRELIKNAVEIVDDPTPDAVNKYAGQADLKDAPILAAAVENGCRYLVTFNTRHYAPRGEHIRVVTPGELLKLLRGFLGSAQNRP